MSGGVCSFCSLLIGCPFLAMLAILFHYQWRRSMWKRNRRKGRQTLGFCPSSVALGTVFLLVTSFYRPRMDFAIEAMLREDAEEDGQGDPKAPEKLFSRQLRRIRRGEPVETLVLRL